MQSGARVHQYGKATKEDGMFKKFGLIMACAVMALGVGGCGSGVYHNFGSDKSREDAVDTKHVDKTAPQVIAFNNKFPNVEHKCDGHGHRVFVTSHGDTNSSNGNMQQQAQVLIVADPSCHGFTSETAGAIVSTGAAG